MLRRPRVFSMAKTPAEIPCPGECDGGRVEFPSHFARGACGGNIIYRSEDCGECGGLGYLQDAPCIECDLSHPVEDLTKVAGGYRCAQCAADSVRE